MSGAMQTTLDRRTTKAASVTLASVGLAGATKASDYAMITPMMKDPAR